MCIRRCPPWFTPYVLCGQVNQASFLPTPWGAGCFFFKPTPTWGGRPGCHPPTWGRGPTHPLFGSRPGSPRHYQPGPSAPGPRIFLTIFLRGTLAPTQEPTHPPPFRILPTLAKPVPGNQGSPSQEKVDLGSKKIQKKIHAFQPLATLSRFPN